MYARDKKRLGDDDGANCFNLFGYISDSKPLYFIYTYLLLLIMKLNPNRQNSIVIKEIMSCLNFSEKDCSTCISKLVTNGMLEQRYVDADDDFAYSITEKGKFVMRNFYNNIQYLYYSCLDTMLPEEMLGVIKNFIAKNNVPVEINDRFFPPFCIITGVSFLNYLKFNNQQVLNDNEIGKKLFKKGITIDVFKLPIQEEENDEEYSINDSINIMLDKVIKNEKYIKQLEEWLRSTK
ncbi:hypothetical protein LJC69_06350 [Bacteroidales bacterium OttesenSCG-928-K22]|nr:hypothetical protein [Bacteroidales bacterium OttesenSCG-928-L14]MDL2241229.1 hypothetical protein [Bacteroidales bacterium OttesenSCG-928-K22]